MLYKETDEVNFNNVLFSPMYQHITMSAYRQYKNFLLVKSLIFFNTKSLKSVSVLDVHLSADQNPLGFQLPHLAMGCHTRQCGCSSSKAITSPWPWDWPPSRWSTLTAGGWDGLQQDSKSINLWFSDVTVGAFMSDSVVLLRWDASLFPLVLCGWGMEFGWGEVQGIYLSSVSNHFALFLACRGAIADATFVPLFLLSCIPGFPAGGPWVVYVCENR